MNEPKIDKNYLINLIYNSKSINAILDKVSIEYRDDFKSHFFLQLMEKDFEKLLEVHNQCDSCLEAYSGGIIRFQLISNNSSFHRTYRKGAALEINERYFETEIEFDEAFKKNYDNILSVLRHLHPKKSKLFIEHYVNNKTLKQISKQYKIKYRTVHSSIRATEEYIRLNLKYED